MLLSVLQQGAQGTTLQQLNNFLRTDAEQSRKTYSKIAQNIKKDTNSSIITELATKAFVNKGFEIKSEFKKTVVNDFYSDIQQLDFSDASFAAKQINAWVNKETHGKVDQIISKDMLGPSVQLVLANALFFKGSWSSPFSPEKTRNKSFKVDEDGKEVFVPTMHRMMFLRTGEMFTPGFKWAEIPFQGKQYVMLVLLPDEGKTLSTLVEHLATTDALTTIFNSKRRRNLDIALPKFKLSTKLDLIKPLKQVGIRDIFSKEKANLTGISEKPLYVSQIVHRVELSIDEKVAELPVLQELY
ncbi:hypothetical protein L9F63_006261 [Diploptera punctata]|uniref:Serpin domain-containing protein n=1 Tax=Diploptera punctata TaxID=6984 RepID=A0AAD8E533_DIPPU|nr:hypothetical protein L9F63_006261 [Diploptera punctata]